MKHIRSLVPLAALLLTGCETAQVHQVDPKTNQVISANQISPQEWAQAADKLVTNLLNSNALARSPEQPAIMAISRITNQTQQQVDTDSLIKKIRVALNQSGKAITTTTMGLGGKAEDPLAKEANEYSQFMNGQKQETKLPFCTLSGKLLEDRVKQGGTTQITYTFQLSLTEVKTGLAIWEAEEALSKVSQKASLGW